MTPEGRLTRLCLVNCLTFVYTGIPGINDGMVQMQSRSISYRKFSSLGLISWQCEPSSMKNRSWFLVNWTSGASFSFFFFLILIKRNELKYSQVRIPSITKSNTVWLRKPKAVNWSFGNSGKHKYNFILLCYNILV